MLTRLSIPSSVDAEPIAAEVAARIDGDLKRIEEFQDRWERPKIEQFVAADYRLVFQTLVWMIRTQMMIGRRFLEWGCGFAVVSAMASRLGFDAIGIEAVDDLFREGCKTIDAWNERLELVHGNFLPPGSESLALDPSLPSLGHEATCAYDVIGLDLDDFAVVYAYPWPGEDDFHEDVFDRYATRGALLMLFCGPNDIRLMRKTS